MDRIYLHLLTIQGARHLICFLEKGYVVAGADFIDGVVEGNDGSFFVVRRIDSVLISSRGEIARLFVIE